MKKKIWVTLAILALPVIAIKILDNVNDLNAKDHKLTQAKAFTTQGFDVASQKVKTFSLKDFKGKWIVMEWFNNQCPFVEKHYGTNNMQDLQKKYTQEGVVWLSIASSKEGKQGFLNEERTKQVIKERKSHQSAVLFDHSGQIARDFRATATPHMFVIDPNGNIVYQGAIDDKPSFRKSTVKEARNFVAEALDISLGLDAKKRKVIEVTEYPAYGCGIKNDLTKG